MPAALVKMLRGLLGKCCGPLPSLLVSLHVTLSNNALPRLRMACKSKVHIQKDDFTCAARASGDPANIFVLVHGAGSEHT